MKTLQITTTPNVREKITVPDTAITGYRLIVMNVDTGTSNYIALGDETVLPSTGIRVLKGETLHVRIGVGEALYVISEHAVDVRVLATMLD